MSTLCVLDSVATLDNKSSMVWQTKFGTHFVDQTIAVFWSSLSALSSKIMILTTHQQRCCRRAKTSGETSVTLQQTIADCLSNLAPLSSKVIILSTNRQRVCRRSKKSPGKSAEKSERSEQTLKQTPATAPWSGPRTAQSSLGGQEAGGHASEGADERAMKPLGRLRERERQQDKSNQQK